MDMRAMHSAMEDLADNEESEIVRSEYNRDSNFPSYIKAFDHSTGKWIEYSIRVSDKDDPT